ncbi:MAG: helix-turn-helix domain-containing protein [Myxococcales bacterium]|nr:MAG: helix-turn-helix domain-containing protein [Myxococcales bacterium]
MTIRSEIQMLGVGGYLRERRERNRMSLSEVSSATRIPERALREIEEDRFDALPGSVFVRGYLRSYARLLGEDDAIIVRGYTLTNDEPMEAESTSISSVPAPAASKRRFALIISLVILAILFALTASIVTRPRHREHKIELSFNTGSSFINAGSKAQQSICPSIG